MQVVPERWGDNIELKLLNCSCEDEGHYFILYPTTETEDRISDMTLLNTSPPKTNVRSSEVAGFVH